MVEDVSTVPTSAGVQTVHPQDETGKGVERRASVA